MSLFEDLKGLELEWRSTVAVRLNDPCICSVYLVKRRDVLFPEILKEAVKRQEDPVDVFATFAKNLHAFHEGFFKEDED